MRHGLVSGEVDSRGLSTSDVFFGQEIDWLRLPHVTSLPHSYKPR
jgi:hypothetical protein